MKIRETFRLSVGALVLLTSLATDYGWACSPPAHIPAPRELAFTGPNLIFIGVAGEVAVGEGRANPEEGFAPPNFTGVKVLKRDNGPLDELKEIDLVLGDSAMCGIAPLPRGHKFLIFATENESGIYYYSFSPLISVRAKPRLVRKIRRYLNGGEDIPIYPNPADN